MRKIKWLVRTGLVWMCAGVILSGCEKKQDKDVLESYQTITAEEAKKRMDSGNEAVILDVRTKEEYEAKHIPGAILIPNETIGEEPLSELPDLDAEILIYCRSGNRSAQAARKMTAAGYTKVYDFGGINEWDYETVSGTE